MVDCPNKVFLVLYPNYFRFYLNIIFRSAICFLSRERKEEKFMIVSVWLTVYKWQNTVYKINWGYQCQRGEFVYLLWNVPIQIFAIFFFIILRFKMHTVIEKDGTQLQNNNFRTYLHVWIIMRSHVFSVSVLLPFLLFVGRIQYQPHVCQLIPKVWTHNWANFHYIRVAIYVYRWSFWFSICGNFVSWCRIPPAI